MNVCEAEAGPAIPLCRTSLSHHAGLQEKQTLLFKVTEVPSSPPHSPLISLHTSLYHLSTARTSDTETLALSQSLGGGRELAGANEEGNCKLEKKWMAAEVIRGTHNM